MRGESDGIPSGWVLVLFVIAGVALIITAALMCGGVILSHTPKVGDNVPCDQYTMITDKYKQMGSDGQIQYMVVTSDGVHTHLFTYDYLKSTKSYWDEIPLNTSGRIHWAFNNPVVISMGILGFAPQNYTHSSEGVNFCVVAP